ncbi:ATP-binding protein [Streptomyces sp. CC210A]|uniref:ATP-binding protein n=1 Tax=Streptomyces sp. CC210A TaxID=2898184 RepID=UPI001F20069C|nr:ATP-binding protein [Streptomyces sp. CC210A]
MKTTPYRSTLVGRARLVERLTQTLHARGRAVLTGPAGVGKSEVAQAAAAEAADAARRSSGSPRSRPTGACPARRPPRSSPPCRAPPSTDCPARSAPPSPS